MGKRNAIQGETQAVVLTMCRRRCCLCYGLDNDTSEKAGQIAHIDRDPENNRLGNLAFLCLTHHDAYDTRRSQSKGYTESELKQYQSDLLAYVSRNLPPETNPDVPVVLATEPANRSVVQSCIDKLRVQFSQPMATTYSLVRVPDAEYPNIDGAPVFSEDGRSCEVQVRLEPGMAYAIWINTSQYNNFRSKTGNPLDPYLLTFYTEADGGCCMDCGVT